MRNGRKLSFEVRKFVPTVKWIFPKNEILKT